MQFLYCGREGDMEAVLDVLIVPVVGGIIVSVLTVHYNSRGYVLVGSIIIAMGWIGWKLWPQFATAEIGLVLMALGGLLWWPIVSPGSAARGASKLRLTVGETGLHFATKSRSIYTTTRTLLLEVTNIDPAETVREISVTVTDIKPQEYDGPWVLARGFSLAAGERLFFPLVRYGEGNGVSTAGDSFFEVLVPENAPKPVADGAHTITLVVTGHDTAPCSFECRVWVEDGRLRISG